jgi:hypothetical protein
MWLLAKVRTGARYACEKQVLRYAQDDGEKQTKATADAKATATASAKATAIANIGVSLLRVVHSGRDDGVGGGGWAVWIVKSVEV